MNEQGLRAEFRHLAASSTEDWRRIMTAMKPFQLELPRRVIAHLELLRGDFGGFPVDRLTHCTQTATLALENGEDEEYVVCALLHDIGDTLGPYNHPDVAATLLQPFVSKRNHWIVQQHGLFQGYYFFEHFGVDPRSREKYIDHPYYDHAERFVRLYDAPAFDPDRATLPLSEFESMVERVFSNPKNSFYAALSLIDGQPRN